MDKIKNDIIKCPVQKSMTRRFSGKNISNHYFFVTVLPQQARFPHYESSSNLSKKIDSANCYSVFPPFQIQRGIPVIPNSINVTRIKENFDIFDFHLKLDEMSIIDAIDNGSFPDVQLPLSLPLFIPM